MSFNTVSFSEKLRQLDSSQQSVTKLSQYIQLQQHNAVAIAEAWLQAAVQAPVEHLLCLMYLVNDVLQSSKSKGWGPVFAAAFLQVLPVAIAVVGTRGMTIAAKIQRVVEIWRERGVYQGSDISRLLNTLDDPDSLIATSGSGFSRTVLLGATFGVLQSAGASAQSHDAVNGAQGTGGLRSLDSPAAGSRRVSGAPRDPLQFYGTGFSSDSAATTAVPVAITDELGGATHWESAAAVKEAEAQAAAASAARRVEAELLHQANTEAFAATRASSPLTVIERAVAALGELGSSDLPEAATGAAGDVDPLLKSFSDALAAIDKAEADVSVSLESAAETLAEAAEAFCVESRLAAAAAEDDRDSVNGSGTVTKAELLAQSKPFDPAPALAVVKRHSAAVAGEKRARESALDLLRSRVIPAQEHQLQETGDIEQLSAVLRAVRSLHRKLVDRAAAAQPLKSATKALPASDPDVEGIFATSPLAPPPAVAPEAPLSSESPLTVTPLNTVPGAISATDARDKQFELQMQALAAKQQLPPALLPLPAMAATVPVQRPVPPRGASVWGGLAADIYSADAAAAASGAHSGSILGPAVAGSAVHAPHAFGPGGLVQQSYAPRPVYQQPPPAVGLTAPALQAPVSSSRSLAAGLLASALRAKGLIAGAGTVSHAQAPTLLEPGRLGPSDLYAPAALPVAHGGFVSPVEFMQPQPHVQPQARFQQPPPRGWAPSAPQQLLHNAALSQPGPFQGGPWQGAARGVPAGFSHMAAPPPGGVGVGPRPHQLPAGRGTAATLPAWLSKAGLQS